MLTARRAPGSQLAGEFAARRCKAYLIQAHHGDVLFLQASAV